MNKIMNLHILPDFLAIEWDGGHNTTIEYKKLRLACPCAHCKGETDVFGNVYKGAPQKLNPTSYIIQSIAKVGHYGVRITWNDNHNTGIYTYQYIHELSR